MIIIGSSFVFDRLNWPDPHKFLGFGWPLPILLESFFCHYAYSTWYLLIFLSKYLDQKTAKWPFRSSSEAFTCYYLSNHSKVEVSR